jgi:hypothetical protein
MKHPDLTNSIAKVIELMEHFAENGSAQDIDDHAQACNDVLVENDIILSDCIFSDGWDYNAKYADGIADEIASQTTHEEKANVIWRFNNMR